MPRGPPGEVLASNPLGGGPHAGHTSVVMHALGRLVGALLLVATAAPVATATPVAADPPAAAPRPQDIRTLIAPPRATLSPQEIVTRLASPDLQQVQEGVRQLWCPPRGEWDDATLRRMVAALADAAHHPVRPQF